MARGFKPLAAAALAALSACAAPPAPAPQPAPIVQADVYTGKGAGLSAHGAGGRTGGTVVTAASVDCPPGAPTLYRGTLYCLD